MSYQRLIKSDWQHIHRIKCILEMKTTNTKTTVSFFTIQLNLNSEIFSLKYRH